MAAWDDRRTWRSREAADRREAVLDATAVATHKLYGHSNEQLAALIDTEREQGRAWGTVAEAARTLLALRTGRGA